MSALTIKNVPKEIHERLKKQAEKNHRSLNQEILHVLEQATEKDNLYTTPEKEAFILKAREIRAKFKRPLTLAEINKAKKQGRL